MTKSKLKALFVFSDRDCTCTVKRTFEVVNGLWRYEKDRISPAAVHINNLKEDHFKDFQVILFQRLGANGEVISEETKANLRSWISRYQSNCRFVYDLDDFLFSAQHNYPQTLAKLCHYGLVPNHYLEQEMSIYQTCRVIKTHVDTDAISRSKKKELPDDKTHIGWFSCSANGLNTIKDALDLMDPKFKSKLQIHLFCDVVFHKLALDIIPERFLQLYPMIAPSEMYQYMLAMQIVINPLTAHSLHEECIGVKKEDFHNLIKGKSEVKYALAGACLAPLIVTPIDSYRQVITHSVNGLFADTSSEWAEMVSMLIENPSKAKIMGQNAYVDIQQNYSLRRAARDYANLFVEICL